MGFDQSSGAMGVGGGVRLGQRIRFMVRDRKGAQSDLMEHALVLKRRQLQVIENAISSWSDLIEEEERGCTSLQPL